MSFSRTLLTALRALRRNVMRAFLTTLGIVIGVGAVIAMMEIGNGSSSAIQRSVASMGANNLLVFPGSAQSGGVSAGAGSAMTLTPQDWEAILRECPAVRAAAPVVRSRAHIVYGGRNHNPQNLQGTTPDFLDVRDWSNLAEGETFTERDVRGAAKVCLLGQTVVRELFDGASPIGKEVRVQNVNLKVIGVLARKGANMMGMDQDDTLLAPWTTIKYRVAGASAQNTGTAATAAGGSTQQQATSTGQLYPSTGVELYPSQGAAAQDANMPSPVRFTNVDMIVASAVAAEQIPDAIDQISAVLRERHRIRPGAPDDFTVRDMTEISTALSSTSQVMTKLLLCVALISLVVGGVGIMNIMLVSVTERTREIGLRMSVGARARDILRQFLTEAVVLCLTGGALGILLGTGSSFLVTFFLGWPTESSPGAVLAAVIVSATVGVVFGYYPAWKASRLDPIEALRYE